MCALTEHFKDRISEYEVWNEPDIAHFWHPQQPDPQKYAEFFSLTAKAIRGVYNNAKIALNITGVVKSGAGARRVPLGQRLSEFCQ